MNKFIKYSYIALALAVAMPVFSSCDDNDDFNTEQFVGDINLVSFGPSPVARGGELRFIGPGMDQITKVVIPGCSDITDIERVSNTEIRVTVPQTAEVGKVQLHYANGILETKTMLTYSEPISIEEITPARVKPGSAITIKGEYLNLIKEVCFPFLEDSVNVYAADFLAHERAQIVVNVPEEAVSGIIILSDAKEVSNLIKAETEIEVVLPSVEAPLDLTNARGGDIVTIKGNDLDLVRTMTMPDGSDLAFKYNAETGEITFTLPDNATDGAMLAIPASGVKVAVANIGMVVPTELKATPATELRAGTEVTISGVNMDQVTTIVFPGVDEAVTPAEITATTVKVAFPAMAKSGNAVLNLKSGKTVEIELSTAKPEVTGFDNSSVAAASSVKLFGMNLDLVVSVAFAGCDATEVVATSASELALDVPATAQTGVITLTMTNGESVATPELTIVAPECANIVSVESTELTAGEVMIATVANGDKLTGVEVNGEAVQYILNGSTLYINLPSNCGKATVIRLISSNGEISYTYDVIPATHVENVIFSGLYDLGNWDGGGLRIYRESLEGIPAGAIMTLYVTPNGAGQIQINDANWGQQDMVDFAADATTVEYVLTADFLSHVIETLDGWSETAIVVNGCNGIISKITISYEQSLETTIWEKGWLCSGWTGNQDLAWGGFDWTSVKAGQILRLYCTATDPSAWWCISLRHGDNWGNIPDIPGQFDTPEGGLLEVVLTQTVLDDIITYNGLVITGDGYTLNKVTIE